MTGRAPLPYPPRLELARTPTPLVRPARHRLPGGVAWWVKRDDLTGVALSGNKVRKLEFLLADAEALGADHLITCGGAQSNHCRATAVAAAQRGLGATLLLRTEEPSRPPPAEGNILLDRLVGAELRWISRTDYARRRELFPAIAEELRARGRRPYVIPEGGSNALGAWGYVRCVEELAAQIDPGPLTIVYAAGSGGTGAGLVLGIALLGLPWRAVGVNVCDDRAYFVREIGAIVEEARARFGLALPFSRDQVELRDGYVGRGYALARPEELALLGELARAEGLILDPVYTGKAFFGMTRELERDPTTLGERVVFLHTGGIFGTLAQHRELADLP